MDDIMRCVKIYPAGGGKFRLYRGAGGVAKQATHKAQLYWWVFHAMQEDWSTLLNLSQARDAVHAEGNPFIAPVADDPEDATPSFGVAPYVPPVEHEPDEPEGEAEPEHVLPPVHLLSTADFLALMEDDSGMFMNKYIYIYDNSMNLLLLINRRIFVYFFILFHLFVFFIFLSSFLHYQMTNSDLSDFRTYLILQMTQMTQDQNGLRNSTVMTVMMRVMMRMKNKHYLL